MTPLEIAGIVLAAVGFGAWAWSRRRSSLVQQHALRETLDSVGEAMVVSDAHDRVLLANRQAARLFGIAPQDLIGRDVETLMPERFRAAHRERRGRYHESPRARTLGLEAPAFALHHDGTEIPVEVTIAPLITPQGTFVVGSIRDVRARHDVEAKLRESEARFRTLVDDVLDNSQVGVCISDARHRVVWINRAYEQYFGEPRSRVVGVEIARLVEEVLAPRVEDPAALREKLGGAGGPGADEFECHVLPGPGRAESWLSCWMQPIGQGLYKGGRIEHYTDVTDRHRAEKTLRLFSHIVRDIRMGLIVYRLADPEDDRSLRVVTINPEGERLLGLPARDLLGRPIDDLFPALRERGIPELFARVARTGDASDVADFAYGDERVQFAHWAFRAFPLPDRSVGVAFEKPERTGPRVADTPPASSA